MFPSFALGFKLVWRNKRRFAVVMSGTIFAISIMASIFLVSNYQGHEMGVSVVGGYQPPIYLQLPRYELNLTEYDQLDELVMEADALGTNIVENVGRDILLPPSNGSWGPGCILYFVTKNLTIDWSNFTVNESDYENVFYHARDDFSGIYNEFGGSGRLPIAPKEVMVTLTLAAEFSIAINDTIAIGNTETKQLATGFKVVGFIEEMWSQRLFIRYSDFREMIASIATSDVIININLYSSLFSVYINLNGVNIYNLNDLSSKITTLANRIQIGINTREYGFTVYNRIQSSLEFYGLLALFILLYLGLQLGLLFPVIVLSNYVSRTIGSEMFEKREVEFSQFRSRGFSRSQMIKVISSEVLISALFCAIIGGVAAVGLSYIFAPITSFFAPGMATTPYNPFFSFETIIIYIALIVGLSIMMVLGIYVQPVQLSFNREMIDSLKAKIKEKRRQSALIGGIVMMYIIGTVPLVLYVLAQNMPTSPLFLYFGPFLSILAIFSPFLISLATIKVLGEKFPKQFGKLCTIFLRQSRSPLKHVIGRNLSAKASKITKLMMIITFTVAFGLTVKLSGRSLTYYKLERNQLHLVSDIRAEYQDTLSLLNSTRANITIKENATATSFMVSAPGSISNMIDPIFMYSEFRFYMVNISDLVDASTIMKDKFLLDMTWNELENQSLRDPDIVLFPSWLQSYAQGQTEIRIEIEISTSPGTVIVVQKNFTVAGYFKAFPGISFENLGGHLWSAPVILNFDPWTLLQYNASDTFDMIACIKTPFIDQPSIDEAAASMHLDEYYTLTNFTGQSNPVAINPLIDMPIFYQLLDLDYWLVFAISMFGIGIITFMKITAERKEIGLFRIRGFDNRMMYQVQLSEKYMPILVGAFIGVVAGIVGGIFVTNGVAFNFFPYSPLLNYSVDIIFPIEDLLIQVIAPIGLYLLVILLAIKLELRQNLSSIIDEED